MGSFFDDISAKAEARRNMSWDRQQTLINSGLTTPSLTNGSMDNSLTDEQKQLKVELLAQKKRQGYSDLMALPVGAVEGMVGFGGDIERLGRGAVGAVMADNGNRWDSFLNELGNSDTTLWNTENVQDWTNRQLEGTEFGDRLLEGKGGRLVGEILAPLPPVAGAVKYGGKGLDILDEGVTFANKYLNKFDIQPGLSIKSVDDVGDPINNWMKATNKTVEAVDGVPLTPKARTPFVETAENVLKTDIDLPAKPLQNNPSSVDIGNRTIRSGDVPPGSADIPRYKDGELVTGTYSKTPDTTIDNLITDAPVYKDNVVQGPTKHFDAIGGQGRPLDQPQGLINKTRNGPFVRPDEVTREAETFLTQNKFTASTDPKAVKLGPNGSPGVATQPPVDSFGNVADEAYNMVYDAKGKAYRQPKGQFNSVDVRTVPEHEVPGLLKGREVSDAERFNDPNIMTPSNSDEIKVVTGDKELDSILNKPDHLGKKQTTKLPNATDQMESADWAKTQKKIDRDIARAEANDTTFAGTKAHLSRNNIVDVPMDTTSKVTPVKTQIKTGKEPISTIPEPITETMPSLLKEKPIADVLSDMSKNVKGTKGKEYMSSINDLANNTRSNVDYKMDQLLRMLDDVQTAPVTGAMNSTTKKSLVDAIQHTMYDTFNQAYKTNNVDAVLKYTKDTRLDGIIPRLDKNGEVISSWKVKPNKGEGATVMQREPIVNKHRVGLEDPKIKMGKFLDNDATTGVSKPNGLIDEVDPNDIEAIQDLAEGNQPGMKGERFNSGKGNNTFDNSRVADKKIKDVPLEDDLVIQPKENFKYTSADDPNFPNQEFDEFLRSWDRGTSDISKQQKTVPHLKGDDVRTKAGRESRHNPANDRGTKPLPNYTAGRARTGDVNSVTGDLTSMLRKQNYAEIQQIEARLANIKPSSPEFMQLLQRKMELMETMLPTM